MNQNFYNSSGFDQFQPPQYPVIYHPPQETSMKILQAREDLMKYIQTFLKKCNCISFRETPKVLLLAWEKFFEIQHAQPEDIQELLNKLLQDLQSINEELAEYINSPSWNRPAFYGDDDDDDDEFEGIFDNACDVPSCDKKHFDAESDLRGSLLNQDTPIVYSPKIDSLLEEFAGELAPIPPGIHEADFDPVETYESLTLHN
ncbi:hypothetical protein Tco_1453725 [Tanacetum coccineum]